MTLELTDLKKILKNLIKEWENEVVEFKEAGNDYKTDAIGKYLSALSNEANLRNKDAAWLVFGVRDKTHKIVGTNYRDDSDKHLQGIKIQMTDGMQPTVTFRNVYAFEVDGQRVIMFEVPAAPAGMPVAWHGHYYARAGESLVALSLDKLDEIRSQARPNEWGMQIVPDADWDDLDPEAIKVAKESFARKHANSIPEEDVMEWSLPTFLDRAKLLSKG